MQKIIAAFDGLKYSQSTEKHAIDIARRNGVHLVGVFLDDVTYHSYKVYDVVAAGGATDSDLMHELNEKDSLKRDESAGKFEEACRAASIPFSIHRDRNVPLQELLQESIYSDLLVINPAETFTHYTKPMPTEFIRDLLSNVQCPVLLTSTVFKPIEKIFMLFDGEPSSVHAVKMFSYILPMYRDLPVEVISVKDSKESLHLPDNRLMKEFMKRHFPHAKYTVLKGDAEDEITNYLGDQREDALVVLGAYRRGMVSRWFRPSMADHLVRELRLPLFIAHN